MAFSSTWKIIRDTIVVLAITAGLFAVMEGVTRFAFPQRLNTTYLGGSSLAMRDEVIGHVNRPNAHALVEGPEFSVEYKINEQGFRDATVYAPEKPDGVTRVLLIGDSMTFGASNQYDEIWPVLAEKGLTEAGQKVELIKAGVPAFDTRSEVLYLERIHDLYRPDIVVFGFMPNDLITNRPIEEDAGHGASSTAGKHDTGVRAVADKKSSLHVITLVKRILMSNDHAYVRLYLMTLRRPYFASAPDDRIGQKFREASKMFSRAQRFCADKGCEFVVLSIPQQFQVLVQARQIRVEGIDQTHIDAEFMRMADEEGFLWVPLLPDLAEAYKQSGEDLYFRYDGHLNRAGNQVVATSVADAFLNLLKSRDEAHFQPSPGG